MRQRRFCWQIAVLICLMTAMVQGQGTKQDLQWAETAANHYVISADQTYGTANNIALHLDVWRNTAVQSPNATLMYIHGGGWIIGDKAGADTMLLPYLRLGWNVVNVEYRLGGQSLAPAAVQDVRCALRWMVRNAKTYNIDPARIIVSGHSAGGHLALMVGMLPPGTDMDSACPGDEPLSVAAVVDWYGITDVNDLLSGPHLQTYAGAWIGPQPLKDQLARSVSPLTYVRKGLPPIIMIHGDQDPTVSYSQSVALNAALLKTHNMHELVTISGGKHGSFSDEETARAYRSIFAFLRTNVPSLASVLPGP
jgi:acetyl esterase/lipase